MKIAVFGAGLIGRKHAEVVAKAGQLTALVDPSPTAIDLAASLNCAHFSSPEAFFADSAADGVIVATPNQLHVAHARLCIDRGVPVFVEKPIADSADEARVLVAEADAAGVPILVGHHRRHNPIVQKAIEQVKAGKLGRLVALSGHFLLYKPDAYFDEKWRRSAGAGPIFINLIHDIDLLRCFAGEVVEVMAMQSAAMRGFDVEDSAGILMRFANGALGTFLLSDTAVSPWSWEFTAGENSAYPKVGASAYQITGTRGALSVPDLTFWSHPDVPGWWEPLHSKTLSVETRDPLARQYEHFADVCRGVAPIVSGQEGLRSLEVVEAVKMAAITGKRVTLSNH